VDTPQVALERENRLIVDCLRQALDDLVVVYRFGSSASDTSTSESDIDIAFLSTSRRSDETRFDIQEQLAARLKCNVDLVDLAAASPVLAMQVITKGTVLCETNSAARGAFEDRTFGAYVRLNEERRGILERIAGEGTVYGR
jgi:predicted nucleotidyltransferase